MSSESFSFDFIRKEFPTRKEMKGIQLKLKEGFPSRRKLSMQLSCFSETQEGPAESLVAAGT